MTVFRHQSNGTTCDRDLFWILILFSQKRRFQSQHGHQLFHAQKHRDADSTVHRMYTTLSAPLSHLHTARSFSQSCRRDLAPATASSPSPATWKQCEVAIEGSDQCHLLLWVWGVWRLCGSCFAGCGKPVCLCWRREHGAGAWRGVMSREWLSCALVKQKKQQQHVRFMDHMEPAMRRLIIFVDALRYSRGEVHLKKVIISSVSSADV